MIATCPRTPSALQKFKADKQNRELQKRQGAEIKKLQEVKGNLDALKAKADVQCVPTDHLPLYCWTHLAALLMPGLILHPGCLQCSVLTDVKL